MSIRFDKTKGEQYLRIPDGPSSNFPDEAHCIGMVISLEGSYAGTDNQVFFSTGGLSVGAVNLSYMGPGHGTPNSVGAQINSSATLRSAPANYVGSRTDFLLVFQRHPSAGLTFKICPILASAPVDGSAVVSSGALANVTMTGAFNGPSGIHIGNRADIPGGRMFDHSISRVFGITGLLTDLEIARLAYGESILEIGKTPRFYFRLNDINDLADLGTDANPALTVHGTTPPTTGRTAPFGYTPAVPAPAEFSTNPAIIGTPTVGAAVSYTPGALSGYPAPAVTRQWLLDGQPIAGATGATYTPLAADETHLLSIVETATNVHGSDSATSAGVAVAAAPTGSNALTPMEPSRIYQRIGTTASVQVSGTYATAPTTIQVQLYASDGTTVRQTWTALTGVTIANNAFSGTLLANQGGSYRAAVRFLDAGGNPFFTSTVDTNTWGVGAILLVAGSSSAQGWLESGSYSNTAYVRVYDVNTGDWFWKAFPTSSNGIAKKFANDLAIRLGVPVGVIGVGRSGSTLAEWTTPGGHVGTWNRLQSAVLDCGGKVEAMLFTMGSNDADNNIVASRSAHLAKLRLFIQKVRDLTGQPNLPVLLSGFNRRQGTNDTQANYVRMAENDVGDDPNVYHFPTTDYEVSADGTHLTTYDGVGDRIIYVFNTILTGGAYRRGPKIVSMGVNGNEVTVTLQHRSGTDITPPTGASGFEARDAGGNPIAITSVQRVDATRLKVVCATAPAALRYMSGGYPDGTAPVMDNGATPLTLHPETEMALVDASIPVTPVSADFVGNFAVRALVGQAFNGDFRVNQLVGAEVNGNFAVRNLVGAGRTLDFAIEEDVDMPMSFTPSAARTVTVNAAGKPFNAGDFWAMSDAKKPKGIKDTDSTLDVTFDWGPWLTDISDEIRPNGLTFVVDGGLTIVDYTFIGSKCTVFVSGGSHGATAPVTCRIRTSSTPPRVEDRTVYLIIEPR